MEELRQLLENSLQGSFMHLTISNPRKKGGLLRIKLRPVLLKGQVCYQEETFDGKQVRHTNWETKKLPLLIEQLTAYMQQFKQLDCDTATEHFTALVSKKGQVSLRRRKKPQNSSADAAEDGMQLFAYEHNRRKKYILEEGVPVDFLVELGVMTREGKVVRARYDKFRQINRFLEFVDDVKKYLPTDREMTIIDFGCGKSYLTFAMYYYLKVQQGYRVHMIGLDLKQDVIEHCNALGRRLGYDRLEFLHGDIAEYEGVNRADMVVTLHACDTATDFALAKAVGWNADVILSVPCCQHELNRQIKSDVLEPLLKYGLIKERTAALFTDALRARLLEQQGYQVQVMEFIDMEHTPKNILIRAVKGKQEQRHKDEAYERCRDFLHAEPLLEKLLN